MTPVDTEFDNILAFFKALADETRLKIVGALSDQERSVEELAGLLDLKPPTVSHHLSKLKEVELVSMRSEGTTHFYRFDINAMRHVLKRVMAIDTVQHLGRVVSEDAFDKKVLKDFFDRERLKEIPASRKKRHVVLRWLADLFDFERHYTEKEVNAIIGRHHCDFATLRRELIGAKLLARESGRYWRIQAI